MNTITLQKETLCNFLDMDLFTLFFHDEIVDTVTKEAHDENVDVYQYLMGKYPDANINIDNSNAYMAKVFIDKLANSHMIL